MTTQVREKLNCISTFAKVAFALACANRNLELLNSEVHIAIYTLAKKSLEDCWRWETEQNVSTVWLYKYIPPLSLSQPNFKKDSREQFALVAILAALEYTVWCSDGYDYSVLNIENDSFPEITDISDETVIECMEYNLKAAVDRDSERKWQLSALEKVIVYSKVDDPNAWEPSIPREFFAAI
jgi:hypothetical protein